MYSHLPQIAMSIQLNLAVKLFSNMHNHIQKVNKNEMSLQLTFFPHFTRFYGNTDDSTLSPVFVCNSLIHCRGDGRLIYIKIISRCLKRRDKERIVSRAACTAFFLLRVPSPVSVARNPASFLAARAGRLLSGINVGKDRERAVNIGREYINAKATDNRLTDTTIHDLVTAALPRHLFSLRDCVATMLNATLSGLEGCGGSYLSYVTLCQTEPVRYRCCKGGWR